LCYKTHHGLLATNNQDYFVFLSQSQSDYLIVSVPNQNYNTWVLLRLLIRVAAPADYPLLMMLVRFCIYAFILIGSIGSMFLPFFYNMYCTSKQLARLQSHIFPCLDLHRCHDFLDNQLTTPIDKMKPCLSALICQLTIYCTLGSCFVVYFVKNMLRALAI
jgi:hypothetical protein